VDGRRALKFICSSSAVIDSILSSSDFHLSTSRSPSIMRYEEREARLGEYQNQDLDCILFNFEATPNSRQGLGSPRFLDHYARLERRS
jgi:hypothetical protein